MIMARTVTVPLRQLPLLLLVMPSRPNSSIPLRVKIVRMRIRTKKKCMIKMERIKMEMGIEMVNLDLPHMEPLMERIKAMMPLRMAVARR